MEARKLMKKLGISKRDFQKYQSDLIDDGIRKICELSCNNYDTCYTYDYHNNLTKKGKVAAFLGIINEFLKFDGKRIIAAKRLFNKEGQNEFQS